MTQPTSAVDQAMADDAELQERIQAQAREYGTYVAKVRIYAGNALAYAVGHPVPVSNVVAHGYFLNGQVALVDGAEHAPEVAESIAQAAPDADAPDDRDAAVVHLPADGTLSPPMTGDGSGTALPPIEPNRDGEGN